MAQHGLLVAVAPPPLLLARPGVVFVWALPARGRALLSSWTWRSLARLTDAVSRPLPAAVLHGLALWVWHAPAAFEAALARERVHALEHGCFFATASLVWRAVLLAWSSGRVGPALGAAFATMLHGGLLGALIAMAPHPLYAWYRGRTEAWGLSAVEDQQHLAGLLMWVPMGIIYMTTCLALASRLVADSPLSRRAHMPHRIVLKSMTVLLGGCLALSGCASGKHVEESAEAQGTYADAPKALLTGKTEGVAPLLQRMRPVTEAMINDPAAGS